MNIIKFRFIKCKIIFKEIIKLLKIYKQLKREKWKGLWRENWLKCVGPFCYKGINLESL